MARQPSTARPSVIVYTHALLSPSMTFILSHAGALRRYVPVFAGAHRVKGLSLPNDRVVVSNRGGLSGKFEELLFRRFRRPGRMTAALSAFKPAVVHAHFGPSGPAGLTLADSLEVPLIVTFHGEDATLKLEEFRGSWSGREYLRGRKLLMQRAHKFIAVSDFIRNKLLEQGFPESKVITHRNGIDLGFFRRTNVGREPVAIFVGRFVEKKGCEYLLRAFGRLRQEGCGIRGLLVGDGPLRPALERLAQQESANVEFAGFLTPAEVRDRIARASVVVVPSVTAADGNSEGLPTVILEAQAMGTPVVTTRHAGNAEGVLEGKSALLTDERDVHGLAQAIRYFAENPDAVVRYGSKGREFVESNFDIVAQVAGLERLYDQVRDEGCPR